LREELKEVVEEMQRLLPKFISQSRTLPPLRRGDELTK